ncbi:hypothetical protein [Runella zeae]|uniref:hypothetical protein n=1 Tax=Runella zeae TaxID=94255 RepID=UPI002357D422|nr:hypothetical protein [Runella zeae]
MIQEAVKDEFGFNDKINERALYIRIHKELKARNHPTYNEIVDEFIEGNWAVHGASIGQKKYLETFVLPKINTFVDVTLEISIEALKKQEGKIELE